MFGPTPPPSRSRRARRLARLAPWLSILSALPLSHAGCNRSSEGPDPGAEPPTGVRIATVTAATLSERGEYLATLRSRRQVAVQPQIDGQITQIFVAAGAHVKAGDPLLQIDPARQAALVSSEARTREARQASLRFLEEQARRMDALYQGGAVSKQELLQAKAAYESSRAEVAALGAQVQHQAVQLTYYKVTAPIAGVIGDIPVRIGDRVTPATLLTMLDGGAGLEAYISVPVERAAAAKLDARVELLDARDEVRVRTRISFIAPSVSEDTQGVLVKALVGDEAEGLRAGQVLRAKLTFSEYQAPAVPVVSVTRMAGQHFAFVVEGEGTSLRARQRPIAVGEIIQARGDKALDLYEVRSGLKSGERVVVSGIQKLHDGSPLTVEEPQPEGSKEPGQPVQKEKK